MLTGDTITVAQILLLREDFPEIIPYDRALLAIALPYGHTAGGIPLFPDVNESMIARNEIAALYNAKRGG